MDTMQKNKKIIGAVIGAIVIAGVSFYAGMMHGQSIATTASTSGQGQFGGNGARARMGNGGFISGDVLSKDANSITIQSPRDGSTKIALYSGTTQILKSTSGTIDDVAVGSSVSVQGTPNSDGSVTAQSIQIRPKMQMQTSGTGAPAK